MEEFKLYSVSDDYVEWLRKDFPNVYSNKINSRTHTRKRETIVAALSSGFEIKSKPLFSFSKVRIQRVC